jgi:hypothetical protein
LFCVKRGGVVDGVTIAQKILCPSCKHIFKENLDNELDDLNIIRCEECDSMFGALVCLKKGHLCASMMLMPSKSLTHVFKCCHPDCDQCVTVDKCLLCSKFKKSIFKFCDVCWNEKVKDTPPLPKVCVEKGRFLVNNTLLERVLCLGRAQENEFGFGGREHANFELLFSLLSRYHDFNFKIIVKKLRELEKQNNEMMKSMEEIKEMIKWLPGLKAMTECKESYQNNAKLQEKRE